MNQDTPIADRNIELLLGTAYKPETPDPAFVHNVEEHLLFAAHQFAHERSKPAAAPTPADDLGRLAKIRTRLGWAMAMAASIAVCAVGWYASIRLFGPRADRPTDVADASNSLDGVYPAHEPGHGLTPRPRSSTEPAKAMAVGATLTTGPAERRLVTLADGSVLYLNQNTAVEQTASRRLKLRKGEVYLEVNPASSKSDKFLVTTPDREVTALGTRFAVKVDGQETGVLVTQGKVQINGRAGAGRAGSVSDRSLFVEAGQQVTAGEQTVSQAPRVSHLLEWTRELMTAACTPLVPGSKHAGGALIAIDPNGQEVHLTLRKYIVDVHIEDGFARTTIDQTYFNNQNWQLEGTFYFPLPPDATLSRLAMYVENGKECVLMEGGMAEREHARNVYEEIRYTNRDPALLEWVDGSTFKMRVFPLEARKEKRVLLSYTQRLPMLYGALRYRFPGGHNMELVREWEFKAVVKNGNKYLVTSDSHPPQESGARGQESGRPVMEIKPSGNDYLARVAAKNIKPNQDVTLELHQVPGQVGRLNGQNRPALQDQARFAGFEHEGQQYLMLRFQPDLITAQPKRERRDWVFLFESGANRDPLLGRAQIEVIRTLLENAEHDDTFSILTAGTRIRLFDKEPHTPTARSIAEASRFLEATHLIGALDLEKALRTAEPILAQARNPYLVHVGAGVAAMGEKREDVLAKMVPANVRYVGIGVGKRWSRSFMKMAADRSSGLFTQINPDEPISWRTFELLATLNTPRLLEVRVQPAAQARDGASATDCKFLTETVSLSQGEELCAVARVAQNGSLPKSVVVTGKIDGVPFTKEIPVENVASGAGYLPRQWAKLEIDRLLAEDGAGNKQAIIDLSKASYVMSPFTSLLVLETEADYIKFKVDRGRKDHWALYACPDRIATVYEPDPRWNPPAVKDGKERSADDVLKTILMRVPARTLTTPDKAGRSSSSPKSVSAWHVYWGAFALALPYVDDEGRTVYARVWNDNVEGMKSFDVTMRLPLWDRETLDIPVDINNSFGGAGYELPALQQVMNQAMGKDKRPPLKLTPKLGTKFSKKLAGEFFHLGKGSKKDLPPDGDLGGFLYATEKLPDRDPLVMDFKRILRKPAEFAAGAEFREIMAELGKEKDKDKKKYGGRRAERVAGDDLAEALLDLRRPRFAKSEPAGSKDVSDRLKLVADDRLHRLSLLSRIRGQDWSEDFKEDFELDADTLAELQIEQFYRKPTGILYQRPTFSQDRRLFTDLLQYAPGLSTTDADVQGVLEAEVKHDKEVIGTVDAGARNLIDKARSAGWSCWTVPGKGDKKDALKLYFNGAGQYRCDRTLPSGLIEQVVCDGATLLHLYPDIGLGGKRTVQRFQRADLADMLPWLVLPADDLARSFNVKLAGDQTIALVPLTEDKAWAELRMVFAREGRLSQRQLVEMPSGKVLYRESYDADGTIHYQARESSTLKFDLSRADMPDLRPDTSKLVLIPMPLRTVDYLHSKLTGTDVSDLHKRDPDMVVSMIAADCLARSSGWAFAEFRRRFHDHGDRRIGFYTLLTLGNLLGPGGPYGISDHRSFTDAHAMMFNIEKEHPKNPLAWYLSQVNKAINDDFKSKGVVEELPGPQAGFVPRLAGFFTQFMLWRLTYYNEGDLRLARREKSLDYVKNCPSAVDALVILDQLKAYDHLGNDVYYPLALKVVERFGAETGLSNISRYETARLLYEAGNNHARAQTLFREFYEDSLKAGGLPLIDGNLINALGTGFAPLVRETASRFAREKRIQLNLVYSWQLWQLGQSELSNEVHDTAMSSGSELIKEFVNDLRKQDADKDKHAAGYVELERMMRTSLLLAGLNHCWRTSQWARAEAPLQKLLEDERLARQPALWRLGATLAQHRGIVARTIVCQEKALDLEFQNLPEAVNLEVVRRDYGQLLQHYQQLATALNVLQSPAPRDFLAKVVQAADRWRSLDPDSNQVYLQTARILQTVGARDLAWDYLTTPIGLKPNEASPWINLAGTLVGEGELDLADRAYAAAFQAEPTNAQILWDRARNLQQLGRAELANQLYRQLANGPWQPRFQGLQGQSQRLLNRN